MNQRIKHIIVVGVFLVALTCCYYGGGSNNLLKNNGALQIDAVGDINTNQHTSIPIAIYNNSEDSVSDLKFNIIGEYESAEFIVDGSTCKLIKKRGNCQIEITIPKQSNGGIILQVVAKKNTHLIKNSTAINWGVKNLDANGVYVGKFMTGISVNPQEANQVYGVSIPLLSSNSFKVAKLTGNVTFINQQIRCNGQTVSKVLADQSCTLSASYKLSNNVVNDFGLILKKEDNSILQYNLPFSIKKNNTANLIANISSATVTTLPYQIIIANNGLGSAQNIKINSSIFSISENTCQGNLEIDGKCSFKVDGNRLQNIRGIVDVNYQDGESDQHLSLNIAYGTTFVSPSLIMTKISDNDLIKWQTIGGTSVLTITNPSDLEISKLKFTNLTGDLSYTPEYKKANLVIPECKVDGSGVLAAHSSCFIAITNKATVLKAVYLQTIMVSGVYLDARKQEQSTLSKVELLCGAVPLLKKKSAQEINSLDVGVGDITAIVKADGVIYASGSGNNNSYFASYNPGSQTWSIIANPLINEGVYTASAIENIIYLGLESGKIISYNPKDKKITLLGAVPSYPGLITKLRDTLYAIGRSFSVSNIIYKYDGQGFVAAGGTEGSIRYCMTSYQNGLIAGYKNGSVWGPSGQVGDWSTSLREGVRALNKMNGSLYAGGYINETSSTIVYLKKSSDPAMVKWIFVGQADVGVAREISDINGIIFVFGDKGIETYSEDYEQQPWAILNVRNYPNAGIFAYDYKILDNSLLYYTKADKISPKVNITKITG